MGVPLSCCCSATGVRFLVIPCPLGNWASLTVGLPALATGPDPNGIVTFHTYEQRPGWAPSKPRGQWCSHDRPLIPGRHLPHPNGNVPKPRCCFHSIVRGFT